MHRIETETTVGAPPAAVWATLVDFERYPDWNPFLRVTGRPNRGAHVDVEIRPPGRRPASFRPTLTVVDRDRELRWLGHLFVPGLYDGEHEFRLADDGAGGTRFVHAETFRGVLAPLFTRLLGDSVERGFRDMNAALKARVEAAAVADGAGWDSTGGPTDPDATAA
jgi:hypothetical protein